MKTYNMAISVDQSTLEGLALYASQDGKDWTAENISQALERVFKSFQAQLQSELHDECTHYAGIVKGCLYDDFHAALAAAKLQPVAHK